MNTQTKIYIALAAAALLTIGILGGAAWSDHKIRTLEKAVDAAKTKADETERVAADKEIEAAVYRQKIDYLERQAADIRTNTRKQDEKLETINADRRRASGDVERARRTRSIETDAAALCRKLAELGHTCEN